MGGNMSSDHPPKKVMNFSFHVESGAAINIYPDSPPPPLPLPSSSSPAKEITSLPPPPPPDSFVHSGDNIPKKDITPPSPPEDETRKKKETSEITHPSPPPPDEETRKKKETTSVVLNPGVFSDFGKKANDLLTKDYFKKDMNKNFINLGTHSNAYAGVDLTLTTLKKDTTSITTTNGLSIDDLTLIYKAKNNFIHLKINAAEDGGNCFSTTTQAQYQVQYEHESDFMNVFMSLEYPDMNRGGCSKVGAQYFIPNGTASTTVGLGHYQSPFLEYSVTFGTPTFAIGGDFVNDYRKSGIHYRAGIRLANTFFDDFSVVVSDDKTFKCSTVQYLDSMKKSCFVAEMKKSFLNNEYPTVTMGTSFEVDHHLKEEMKTVVKAKVAIDNQMKMGVVLKQHFMENRIVQICSEFDLMDLNRTPKIGLSLVL